MMLPRRQVGLTYMNSKHHSFLFLMNGCLSGFVPPICPSSALCWSTKTHNHTNVVFSLNQQVATWFPLQTFWMFFSRKKKPKQILLLLLFQFQFRICSTFVTWFSLSPVSLKCKKINVLSTTLPLKGHLKTVLGLSSPSRTFMHTLSFALTWSQPLLINANHEKKNTNKGTCSSKS